MTTRTTNSPDITKEESLRLYGVSYEIDGEIIHPSRVRVDGDRLTCTPSPIRARLQDRIGAIWTVAEFLYNRADTTMSWTEAQGCDMHIPYLRDAEKLVDNLVPSTVPGVNVEASIRCDLISEEQADELIVRMKNEIPSDLPEGAVRFIKGPTCPPMRGKINEQRREEILEDWKQNPPQAVFMTEQPQRYFVDCDGDSHYFLIPVERREEWNAWLEIPTDDERAWTAPAFAYPLGGGPSSLTFERVEDNGKSIP